MKCPKCHSENPDTSRFCGNCASLLSGEGNGPVSITKTVETTIKVLTKGSLVAGKYRILEEIGKGGMGIVYKAEDTKLKRTVALKFLPPQLTLDQDARERFVHEAQAASALDHANICNIHEIEDTEAGQMYIAMAYYEGESLREKIKRGPLSKEEALDIASQLAQGMAKAHQKGIIHRDLKPANVVIAEDGVAKIVDFGLAKLAGQMRLTRDGVTMGTVAYMSPEQAQGQSVDHRTDIWSLGVVIYEMITGQVPFKGDYEQSIIHSILNREPEPIKRIRKDLPVGLEHVIGRALEKKPADRYQTMEELLGDLKAIAEGLKPLKAKPALLRCRILGLKKIYAYAALAGLLVLFALAMILLVPKRGQAYDSIAVLPLVNQSGNPDRDYFSDGMHTELIMELSRIRSIKVINKMSMMGYKGTTKRSSEIARELGVSTLVGGSVRSGGNRIRISVELIDGRTDKNLWAGNFDGEDRDSLALQSEAALAIAKQIQATLTPDETKALERKRSVNPDAYDAYLKGKSILDGLSLFSSVPDRGQYDKCLEYFEQATKIDPDFALGYAGKALAYCYLGAKFGPTKELFPKAKEAAFKALSVDDSLPEPQFVLADLAVAYDWDREGGVKEFQRIFEVYPNYALAHSGYAADIITLGRLEESISHAERARELDPLNFSAVELVPRCYFFARQYDKAVNIAREISSQYPDHPAAHANLAVFCLWAGLFEEASAEHQKAVELGAKDPFWQVRFLALSGEKPKAKRLLDDLLRQMDVSNLNPGPIAHLFAMVGDKDKTFEMLEKAYEVRSTNVLCWINVYPAFDFIRSDPRYAALARKMGLEKYWINR